MGLLGKPVAGSRLEVDQTQKGAHHPVFLSGWPLCNPDKTENTSERKLEGKTHEDCSRMPKSGGHSDTQMIVPYTLGSVSYTHLTLPTKLEV